MDLVHKEDTFYVSLKQPFLVVLNFVVWNKHTEVVGSYLIELSNVGIVLYERKGMGELLPRLTSSTPLALGFRLQSLSSVSGFKDLIPMSSDASALIKSSF